MDNEKMLIWTRRYEEEDADDLFREEEDPKDENPKLKDYQKDVADKGMLQVRTQEDWSEKVITHLGLDNPRATNLQTILDEIDRVGKVTCYVRRKHDSKGREDFHKKLKDDTRLSAEVRKYHEQKYQKALSGKGGSGTGFLISPEHASGWLVLTNNHVIMNKDEANSALVVFDYLHDNSSRGSKKFFVAEFVCGSLRTECAEDRNTLDYSLLGLKCERVSDQKFLEQHAMPFEETWRVQWGCTIGSPVLAFSHPHGLSKRMSLGYFDSNVEEYPAKHIRHSLPTTPGSSGANICCRDPTSEKQETWMSVCVHYRASLAVGWQSIGNHLRSQSHRRWRFSVVQSLSQSFQTNSIPVPYGLESSDESKKIGMTGEEKGRAGNAGP